MSLLSQARFAARRHTLKFLQRTASPRSMSIAAQSPQSATYTEAGRDVNAMPRSIKLDFFNISGKHLASAHAREGDNILDLAHSHGIDLEGSCEGQVACSTCHVVLSPEDYSKIPPPKDNENDMLDMAHGLTDTSRLGCQVQVTRAVDGLVVTVPNAYGLRKKAMN